MKTKLIKSIGYTTAVLSIVLPVTAFADMGDGSINANVRADVQVQTQSKEQNQEQDNTHMNTQVQVQDQNRTPESERMMATSSGAANQIHMMNDENSSTTTDGHMNQGDNMNVQEREMNGSLNGVININRENVDNVSGSDSINASITSSTSPEINIETHARTIVKSDKNVENISIGSSSVAISYNEPTKLLGFIPSHITVTAETDANGNVTVTYPWYAFFMKTNSAALHASASAQVHAAAESAVQASSTASITLQTALLNALHAAFQAQAGN